jgi:signal transduction histidine kinase/ligand-binding sensor domain-containing protein
MMIRYFIFFLSAGLLSAQNNSLKLDHIGADQGLSQISVHSIVQDAQGFIWFGTQEGLNRYDGYSVNVFKHDPLDPTSISDNFISCLFSDNRGDLWVGTTQGGLNRYVISENKFYHYPHINNDSTSLSENYVTSLFQDSDGDIWVGTRTAGLNRLNVSKGTFTHYKFSWDARSYKNNTVWAIIEDRKRNLWVGTNYGLAMTSLDAAKKPSYQSYVLNYIKSAPFNNTLENIPVQTLLVSSDGTIWGGGGALFSYNEKTDSFKCYRKLHIQHSVSSDYIMSMCEDFQKRILVGTYEKGILIREKTDDSFSLFSEGENIMALYTDRSGIVWIGTLSGGIKIYDWHKNQFNHIYDKKQNNTLPNSNVIMSLLEDRDGELWVGTFGGGLKHFDKNLNKLETFTKNLGSKQGINNNKIVSLCESKDGSIWIGTYGGGLNRYNKKTGMFKKYEHFPEDPNSIMANEITALYENSKGCLWIGYYGGGIDYFNPADNTFTHYYSDNNVKGPSGTLIFSIYEDKSGNILIGTMGGGLNLYHPETNTFSRYLKAEGKTAGLGHNTVLSIYEDNNGVFWFGTFGGLNGYDPKTGVFKYFTEKNGLTNNVVWGIVPDKKGHLWLSTNNGISCFDPVTEGFRNLTKADGLQENEYNQGAYFRGRNGLLYFGGINGFNAFDPDKIESNNYVPPVYLTSFKLFDKPLQLTGALSTIKQIDLTFEQNFFSFEFVALNYTSPEENEYAYYLDGFDKDWHRVSAQNRYASYTNLDPGTYTLRVKGSNNNGIWNDLGTSVLIIVKPPYWMTWWFRILMSSFLLYLIFFFYKRRVKYLEREKNLQQEISHKLITKQEEERSRIAQELHDSLGQNLLFIKNRALLSLQNELDSTKSISTLKEISETASGILKSVKQISYNLRPPELDRLGLTETLRSILIKLRESTSLKVSGEIDQIDGLIPRELEINLVRVLQEAIKNIISHSEATECRVIVQILNKILSVEIIDNGCGFDNMNRLNYSVGLGLSGIAERIKLLQGTFNISSSPGNGTRIVLHIPVTNQNIEVT